MINIEQESRTSPIDAAASVAGGIAPSVDAVTSRRMKRETVDRAKIMLMSTHGLTEPEAYRWIQKTAMDSRSPMMVDSTRIVDGYGSPAARAS